MSEANAEKACNQKALSMVGLAELFNRPPCFGAVPIASLHNSGPFPPFKRRDPETGSNDRFPWDSQTLNVDVK